MDNLVDIRNDEMGKDAAIGGETSYPFGTQLQLDAKTLAKLGLDCDCEPGDQISFDVLATVKSVNKTEQGAFVALQITHLGLEDEEEEDFQPKPLPYNTMR